MYRWMQMGIIRTVRIRLIHRTALTVRIRLIHRTTQVVSK
jgi:Fe2+ transport system protein FeoA